MGDRCYFEMLYRKEDVDIFEETFYEGKALHVDIGSDFGPYYYFVDDEINYGGEDELFRFANVGGICCGWHGGGCDYGPSKFLTFNNNVFRANVNTQLEYVCRVDHNLQIDPTDSEELEKFLSLRNTVLALIRRGTTAVPNSGGDRTYDILY